MCSAIRHNGLEPEAVNLQNTGNVPLASLLYGYLKMGLPVILIVQIPDSGWHGITLTGYSLLSGIHSMEEVPGNTSIAPMVGRRIDRFYGHDDQIGPNSKLVVEPSPIPTINGQPVARPGNTQCPIRLASAWKNKRGFPTSLYPVAVAVPVYSKIRLTFLEVQAWITPLQALFARLLPEPQKIEWDVHLTLSNVYKQEIRTDPDLTESARASLLMNHHPRFWWKATMRYDGVPFCHLLFDATGIARSFPLSMVVWPVDGFAKALRVILDQASPLLPSLRELLRSDRDNTSDRYMTFLRTTLDQRATPAEALQQHLKH